MAVTDDMTNQAHSDVVKLLDYLDSQVVGQHSVVKGILLGLLSSGHVLLEVYRVPLRLVL